MYYDDFESFKPIDFLNLSKELYDNSDNFDGYSSALKRTIVDRCYYAAFLHARQWLIVNKNYKSHGPSDHRDVPNAIMEDTPLMSYIAKDYRDKLITLKKNRQFCDYDLTVSDKINNKTYNLNIEDIILFSEEIISVFISFDKKE